MGPRVLSADPTVACEQLAEIAFETNQIAEGRVSGEQVFAVPDVLLLEYVAQGRTLPDGLKLRRCDGREAAFFRIPGEVAS